MTLGAALFVSGIALFIISFFYLAQQFLPQDEEGSNLPIATVERFSLEPMQSRNTSAYVSPVEDEEAPPLSAVIVSDQPDAPMHASITSPDGRIENQVSFNDNTLLIQEPKVPGNYNLTITNNGTQSADIEVVFGYNPTIGEGGQINIAWAQAMAIGGVMVIAGIIIGIIGIIMRKRD